jgi:Holliday junction resolvase RusA-like endonuclease
MREINAVVYMNPVGKARARTFQLPNGKHMSFTPAKTVNAENLIRAEIVGKFQPFDSDIPLGLSAIFCCEKPKSAPKRREYPITKPDLDNMLKLILDALNGYAYHDDSQLVSIVVRKKYIRPEQVPHIIILIKDIID